jgi:hypothetical protein
LRERQSEVFRAPQWVLAIQVTLIT